MGERDGISKAKAKCLRLLAYVISALAAWFIVCGPTAAEPDDEIQAAVRAAGAAYDEGNYRQALDGYLLALEEMPESPILRYNIGLCYELLGEKEQAALSYRNYLERKEDAEDSEEVEGWIRSLEANPVDDWVRRLESSHDEEKEAKSQIAYIGVMEVGATYLKLDRKNPHVKGRELPLGKAGMSFEVSGRLMKTGKKRYNRFAVGMAQLNGDISVDMRYAKSEYIYKKSEKEHLGIGLAVLGQEYNRSGRHKNYTRFVTALYGQEFESGFFFELGYMRAFQDCGTLPDEKTSSVIQISGGYKVMTLNLLGI